MATRAREGVGAGGRGRGGNNSSSNSSEPPKPQKPLPNYLRPTISSSLDFSSSSRASRRSNPPSPGLRPKSSTAATRTPPSIKPAPQRSFSGLSSRSTKAPAGPSTRRSSSAKASPANSSTSVNRVRRKASVTSESSVDFDARDEDPSDHVIDAPAATVELDTVAKDAKNEDVIVAEEGELVLQEAAPCEKEQHPVGTEEERSNEEMETEDGRPVVVAAEEERSNEEMETEDRRPVVVAEEERSNEEMETEDRPVNQGGDGEEDSTKVDEKHVVVELEGSKVREDTSVEVVQVKIESPAIVKAERPAKQTQPRKKETQAYNDVIEETASKLMENKRNKVRALAGAFETVISLQDTTK